MVNRSIHSLLEEYRFTLYSSLFLVEIKGYDSPQMHSSLFCSEYSCTLKPLGTLCLSGGWMLKMYAVPRRILCSILNMEDMKWRNVLGSDIEEEAGKGLQCFLHSSYFFLYISIKFCFQIGKGLPHPMTPKETEF